MSITSRLLKQGGLARILIGAILLVTVFLCSQLAMLYMQSALGDYQFYLQHELSQTVNFISSQLDSGSVTSLSSLLDGLEAYYERHDITANSFNSYQSTSARITFEMRVTDQDVVLFSYDRENGFERLLQRDLQVSMPDIAKALAQGNYQNVGLDGTQDDLQSVLAFDADGIHYTLRIAIPRSEPLQRTIPIVILIVIAVIFLVALLFLFLRYNQSLLYSQAVQSAKRTQLVLDHLPTSIFVTRPETGELLFVNQALRAAYALPEEPDPERFLALQNQLQAQSKMLPLYRLQGDPGTPVTWELQDCVSGKCLRNSDYLIEWDDGTTVLMEHAMDVTEELRSIQRMQRQIERQKLLSQLSIEVATNVEEHTLFERLLKQIGAFLDVDHVWVMRLPEEADGLRLRYVWQWHQPLLSPMPESVTRVELKPSYPQVFSSNSTQVKVIVHPEDLPVQDTAPFERMHFYSGAYVTLLIGEKPWGVLCLGMQERTREWTAEDQEMVRTFSGILATAIQNELMQTRLRDTQRTLRSILEHIPLGIYWKDKDSRYIGANQIFMSMMGVQADTVTGKTDSELFPEEFARDYYETDQIAINTGEIYEDFIRTRVDTVPPQRWLRRKKLAVQGEDGETAFILGIVEDITQQKRAEIKRDESLSVLSAAMANYPGMLFSLDMSKRVVLMGGMELPAAEDADYAHAVGKPVAQVFPHLPALVERCGQTFTEGAQTFPIEDNHKVFNFYTAQIQDADGTVRGIVVTGLDMTQELALRKELEAAIVEAEQASSAKSDFLSRMSHEIRTPMNVIIGMCRMALRAKDAAKVKHSLLQIDASAKHLLGLINDILDMSKIEANKLTLHNEAFDIEKMLMEVCSAVQVRANERHQTIQVLMARGMPHHFIGDELRLSQVLTNLFTNAIKFSPDRGNIVLSIKVLERQGDIATLEARVRDHGIGMTREQLEKLFVSFEQADGGIARKYGGTGLGLAICKSIVTMMDGDIWAESEYGKGSTFVFTVKMQLAQQQKKREVPRELSGQELKTLVVDDSIETCMYIADIMEGFGIACDQATSGAEALAKVAAAKTQGHPYDIVFIDWQMPEMDGLQTIRQLRGVTEHQVPVIMISSADLTEIEDEAKTLGVQHFVPKPLFPSDLFNVVHNILGLGSMPAHTPEGPLVATAPNLTGHVILLAEDMEFNREVAIGILEETGCEIDEAVNGLEALEMFEKNPTRYSCILMDMQMPGMDGLQATQAIRGLKNIHWAKKIPIIAMTANVFRDDVEKCLEAGMDDHIGKPISDSILYEKMAFYLHSQATMQKDAPGEPEPEPQADPRTFLPYLDITQGLSRLRDNRKLFATLLASFARNPKFEELLAQIQSEQLEEAARTAHAIKGIAGNIELAALYQAVIELENTLKARSKPTPESVENLREIYQKTVETIPQATKYLSRGKEG